MWCPWYSYRLNQDCWYKSRLRRMVCLDKRFHNLVIEQAPLPPGRTVLCIFTVNHMFQSFNRSILPKVLYSLRTSDRMNPSTMLTVSLMPFQKTGWSTYRAHHQNRLERYFHKPPVNTKIWVLLWLQSFSHTNNNQKNSNHHNRPTIGFEEHFENATESICSFYDLYTAASATHSTYLWRNFTTCLYINVYFRV